MFKGLKLFKIIPKVLPSGENITEVSLVDKPAIDEIFLKFSEEESVFELKFSVEDQQIVEGVVMIPNHPFYRKEIDAYVYYDEEGIKKAAELFFKNEKKFNINHSDKKINVNLLESYFTNENNSFNVPKNSWVMKGKIDNKDDWEIVKNELKGFSIESNFDLIEDKKLAFQKETEIMSVKEKILEKLSKMLFEDETIVDETDVPVVEDVKVDEPVIPIVEDKKIDEPINPIVEDIVEDVKVDEPDVPVVEDKKVDAEMELKIKSLEEQISELTKLVNKIGETEIENKQKIVMDTKVPVQDEYSFLRNINK